MKNKKALLVVIILLALSGLGVWYYLNSMTAMMNMDGMMMGQNAVTGENLSF